MRSSLLVVCTTVVVIVLVSHGEASEDAKRLYDDLLGDKGGYNKLIRPVGNTTDRLVVKIGLRLSQIIDVVSAAFAQFMCVTFSISTIFPHAKLHQ